MKSLEGTSSRSQEPSRRPGERPPTTAEILAWYRERDHDPEDLHRRYVRAKFRMVDWSEEDLARFHKYKHSLPRERAAQLVIVRRHAVRGATGMAVIALVAAGLWAAIEWWKRQTTPLALPAGTTKSASTGTVSASSAGAVSTSRGTVSPSSAGAVSASPGTASASPTTASASSATGSKSSMRTGSNEGASAHTKAAPSHVEPGSRSPNAEPGRPPPRVRVRRSSTRTRDEAET